MTEHESYVCMKTRAVGDWDYYRVHIVGDHLIVTSDRGPSRYGVAARIGTIISTSATKSGGVRWQTRTDQKDLAGAVERITDYLSGETDRL